MGFRKYQPSSHKYTSIFGLNKGKSAFKPMIRDMLAPHNPRHVGTMNDTSIPKDSLYHKAFRHYLHHLAISKLALEKNKVMSEVHKEKANKLKDRLKEILRQYPLPSEAIRIAKEQKIPTKTIGWHLAELDRDKF